MEKIYICPHCGVMSGMEIYIYIFKKNNMDFVLNGGYCECFDTKIDLDKIIKEHETLSIVTCKSCKKFHIKLNDKIIYPQTSSLPVPNHDMPSEIISLYNEARNIFESSPRASAALLRLALQKLCIELGEKGENLNKDIGALVEKKQIPETIQKAFDSIRIIGNNAVHPGNINLEENKDSVAALFSILNFIVEKTISESKKINEIYNLLPLESLKAIEKRDKRDS